MTKTIRLPRPHRKARLERPPFYPQRFPVPDDSVEWSAAYPGYEPPSHESAVVLQNDRRLVPGGWADPQDLSAKEIADSIASGALRSFEGTVKVDSKSGMPLNPFGRTGLKGRGLLGRWGPNFAADPIVTRWNDAAGRFEMITILRDTGEWALPGGMVDFGEDTESALKRELREETGVSLRARSGIRLYEGYVDDPRTTDNAWFETSVELFHLSENEAQEITLRAGSDALDARWMPMEVEKLKSLYASHGFFAIHALRILCAAKKLVGAAAGPELWEPR